ncbi:Protein of unknown function [Acinetobacter marinus]|uniref:DUF2789 domain-containing protein n=2 Tax=Acinetobacter marinus TaxID=281375 RepID=A0A1G6NQF1_9GAMM|nr:Protein of unknown function [Acinetobacter marinus]
MMNTSQPSMTHLFEQLGLDADESAIQSFIKAHQLGADVYICDAPFWNTSQRALLAEKTITDDDWTIVVDQLNEALHEDSV